MNYSLAERKNSRWADQVRTRCNDKKEAEYIRKKLSGPLPDSADVTYCELKKTDFESYAIDKIGKLLDVMCQSVQLSPRGITKGRVHILSQNDFRLIMGGTSDAVTIMGHSYICRAEDPVTMLFLLTHELAHLASFLSLICISKPAVNYVSWHRSGFSVQTTQSGNTFTGLNEAATEIVAGLIRTMLVRKGDELDDSTREEMKNGYLYAPQVRVLESVIETITSYREMDEAAALMAVIDNYLTGKTNFLRMANHYLPKSVPILRAMSEEPNSALIAAHALGLQGAANDIEQYISSREEYLL